MLIISTLKSSCSSFLVCGSQYTDM